MITGLSRYYRMKKINILILIFFCVSLFIVSKFLYCEIFHNHEKPYLTMGERAIVANISSISDLDNGKWIRCFRTNDRTIYFRGHFKSTDGGITIVPQIDTSVDDINAAPERAVLSLKSMFYAAGGYARIVQHGVYSVDAWRSTDELKTITSEQALVYVPEGPSRDREKGEWYGLYVYRTIIEMPDGSWLMSMYGHFKDDTLPPQDSDAKAETTFMTRAFLVKSADQGHTWRYLSSIAVPRSGDPIGEGYGSLLLLVWTTAGCYASCEQVITTPCMLPGVLTQERRGPRHCIRGLTGVAIPASSNSTTAGWR